MYYDSRLLKFHRSSDPKSLYFKMRDPANYFSKQAEAADAAQKQELAVIWQQIQDYHQRRHWHQLTNLMLELVVRPELQTGEQLNELYNEAIADFESK